MSKFNPPKISTGFSLMELLIALFVFSLLSGFAFFAVKQLTSTSSVLTEEQTTLDSIARFWLLLEQDIRMQGVSNSFVGSGLQTDEQFPLGAALYRLEGGALYRKSVLTGSGAISDNLLLRNIEAFNITCQRKDDPSCSLNNSEKDLLMISVELKGLADIDIKRVFYIDQKNPIMLVSFGNSNPLLDGFASDAGSGGLQEDTQKEPPPPEEQEVIDVIMTL